MAPFYHFNGPAVLVNVEGVVTPEHEDELQISHAVLLLLCEGWWGEGFVVAGDLGILYRPLCCVI